MATDRYSIQLDVQQATAALGSLRNAVRGFVGILAANEIAQFGQSIIAATREFQNYQNQLRLVTRDSEDLNRVISLLEQTAVRNRTSFAATADLFVKLRISTEALAISEERVVAVTSKLSQALQVAGADTATTNAVIRQFGQAMASGEVRGDEFRSLVEGLGPALAIMARESGLTVGELRRMSQEGELTAETMFKILENSRSLTAAFNSMQPTIAQLETATGDAFDRMLRKIAEVTGATQGYEGVLRNLARSFDAIAGTEGALVNLEDAEIMSRVRDGTISATAALEEFNSRYKTILQQIDDLTAAGVRYQDVFSNLFGKEDTANRVVAFRNELRALIEEQERQAAATKAEEERIRALNARMTEILAPYQRFIRLGQEYEKLDFGTPLERAIAKQSEARETLAQLRQAQQRLLEAGLANEEDALVSITSEIRNAERAVAGYTQQVQELVGLQGFDKFYDDLIKTTTATVSNAEYARQAIERLMQDLGAGAISADVFAEAVERINKQLKVTDEVGNRLSESIRDYTDGLNESLSDAQFEFDKLNMNALEIQLESIKRTLERDLKRQVTELRKLASENPTRASEIESQIEQITQATNETIAQQQRLAEQAYENQRSFQSGWNNAFKSYADDATNAAKQAERIFQKATSGMEDAIVNFAKTGKFEFKGFINSILEELLRSKVQQLIASLFSGGGSGGGGSRSTIGRLLGFANGGIIPTNAPVLVGERGPELLVGASGNRVIPNDQLGGGTTVVYNINAVDALSFRDLIASDPTFIHAVAEQGRRSLPQTRR